METNHETFKKIESDIIQYLQNSGYNYITRNGDDVCVEYSLNCFKHEPTLVEKYKYYVPDSDYDDEINENESGEIICIPHIFFPMITFESGIIDMREYFKCIKD